MGGSDDSSSTFTSSCTFSTPSVPAIDQSLWQLAEWFGNGSNWQYDFVKWIILATEEPRESSEQPYIETGLKIIHREIEEIYTAGMIPKETYNLCLELINKSKSFRLNHDKDKRNDLLNITFNYLQVKHNEALTIIKMLKSFRFEQRSVLRFMTHQKVQAKIAFLRTTLKSHKTTYDMERYHCITNPYYDEVFKQKQAAVLENKSLEASIKAVRNSNSELNQRYGNLLNEQNKLLNVHQEFNEYKENNEKLYNDKVNENKILTTKNEQLIVTNKELKDQLKEKEALEKKGEEIVKEVMANNVKVTQERDKIKSAYEANIKQHQEESKELLQAVKSAKEEATTYQAALGSATNIRWSDSTLNNPIQLTKDIENLQHSLTDFTKVKGKSIKINEDAAKQLLADYKCKAILDSKEIKNYLAGALQRMILETIFYFADGLFKHAKHANSFSDKLLESYIVYYASYLIEYTNILTTTREGKDSVTAVTPVKIRQQVYAALGSRGFANSNHPLVSLLVNKILFKMEKYREVIDDEKKNELRSDAEKVIRAGLQLWFCLKAQEPIAKIQWFKPGAHLESHLTVGNWENENIKEMEVDFAYFPLIMSEHDNQVFSKAQVFVRPKENGRIKRFLSYIS
ncbi:4854_t:CDS:1 [Funneliformis caledonium]|uniref:4854_t:CDS:1 n=1 Tax=Funneliformis caledonium TaxID=1117310 RepID=A0A9N9FTC7_9GLOM|nr:4854_t:CDS:1 [Funneliformis caledonium]